jgi:two-component system, OmpR family, sensor kinase
MTAMPRRRWLVGLVPAALGLAVAWVLRRPSIPDPLLELQTEFHAGTLLLTVGVLISLAWLEGLVIWHVAQDRLDRAVSARQRMAAEARQRFIRRVDHELKNPLTAAYAALDNIDAAKDGPDRHLAIRDVTSQLKRAEALMRSLRKLVDLEMRPIEQGTVDVDPLLHEVREACDAAGDAAPRCRIDLAGSGPWLVEGDRDLLWMLFYNLLDNAYKFSAPTAPVTIEIATLEDWIRVTVSDRGAGIAADDVPHVFEELYRGDNAAGVEGSGIGLALVRTVAERHGGTVAVESAPGTGSTFTVQLPRLHRAGA